jgi:cell division protein FtsZ
MIQFDIPQEQSSIIKVIGIGGGGGNAVNHMFSQNIDGVNFIICNTDAQALTNCKVPNRIQLGPLLTSGLGAGANPEIGRQATEESLEEVRRILEVNTKMAFITAGMGGGTGTGGAPIVAKTCKDLGILTVGIVTMPFAYEGKKRQMQAEEGIKQLKQYVDTLLVISNDKLRHQFGNLKMREAFEKADNVLATAAKCITDVISSTGQINVDFADVCTVMRSGGVAILGNAAVSGENRAQRAIEEALNSPLLNDNDIRGAKWILININSAEGDPEFTMDEVEIIQSHLLSQAGENTDVILGLGYDNTLGENIGITIIATGFENKDLFVKPVLKREEVQEGKIVMTLNPENAIREAVVSTVVAEEIKPAAEVQKIEVDENVTANPLAPQLVEEDAYMNSPMPTLEDITDNEAEEETMPLHYFLSEAKQETEVAAAQLEPEAELPVVDDKSQSAFYAPAVPGERVMEIPAADTQKEEMVEASRSFLAKPFKIYVEQQQEEKPVVQNVEAEAVKEEQMELVEKTRQQEEVPITNEQTANQQTSQHQEEDDMEMQKRKHLERLQKLRNLSFNVNANDPNSEFETVPAYIRRNMELYNHTVHVENYYSKYEVTPDEKNQGQLNTINTFLYGKKPD